MKKRIAHYSIATFLLLAVWKCATITTPQGGPKDETPPTLVKSNPKQNQKNFKEEIIQLTFDEDIKLKDPKEEIIITPSPGKETNFVVKEATLTIKPKDRWLDSTTYSISFREGVQDLSEGNPVPNLRLAFSTGPTLDSLSISGSIKDAISEKIPEKITIGLYTQDTFNIFKHTPSYFTQTKKDGTFSLENLKPANYLIYAFEDKNKNLKVDSPAETFGFLADTIYLIKNTSGLIIPLLKIDARPLKLTSGRSIQDLATVKFNKAIKSYELKEETGTKLDNSFGDDQTQIAIYINQSVKDSVKISVTATDSLLQKVDTSFYIKRSPSKRQHDQLKISFADVELDSLNGELRATFTSNKIIKYFNHDSINLRIDSALVFPILPNDIAFDTVTKKGSIKKKIEQSKIILNKKTPPKLQLGKDFACSIENDSIKGQKLSVKTQKLDDTGTLSIEVNNTTNYDLILQLITANGKLVKSITNPKKYVFNNLIPDTYKIKIIHDKNCNAKWDYGNVLQRQEPEAVSYYQTIDNKYEIPIRANWEVGPLKITVGNPGGTPKDEKPPTLVASNPKQAQKNFSDSTVILTFDEPVKLNDAKQQIIITPSAGNEINTSTNGKTLTLTPKGGWKKSTTYIISFRDAIQDVRGSNTAPNLSLIFSTGSSIDSLTIKGSVKDATTENIPKKITVAIVAGNKFNPFKNTPSYFTRTNDQGAFTLKNLKSDSYFIYAFEDTNSNLKIDSPTESYGFLSAPVNLSKNIEGISIPLLKIDIRMPKVVSTKHTQDLTKIILNKSINDYTIANKSKLKLLHSFGDNESQIDIYIPPGTKDSIKISLTGTDSLFQKIDTALYIKRSKTKKPSTPLKVAFIEVTADSLTGTFKASFIYNKRIAYFNPNRAFIRFHNTPAIPLSIKNVTIDTLRKTGTIEQKIEPRYISRNKKYPPQLQLLNDFICSVENDSINGGRIPIEIITGNETASLKIEVTNTSTDHYIIQLLTSNGKIIQSTKDTKEFTFNHLPTNTYKLRIIIDKNNNGQWDYGNILKQEEPEKIFFFRTPEKKSTFQIKPSLATNSFKIMI